MGDNSSSTINYCYYNSETSGQSSGVGIDDNSQSVVALSTAQMKQDGSFVGWDFTNTWKIDNNITFPRLVNVENGPIILQNLTSIIKVNKQYTPSHIIRIYG